MEKLYELVEEGGFDLVVVDTPPTRNALDFLDAPRRLTRFLENRVFQALMKPTRAGLKFMGVAAQALLRTISRVAGADIVRDAVAFFQAFEGMEEGFRTRAARVRELLVQDGHRLHPGGLAPSRLGRRSRPFRRQAGRVGHGGHRPGGQPGPAPVRRRRPAGRPLPAVRPDGPDGSALAGPADRQPAGLHRRLGPRGAGLRRPGGQGGPGPGLPGPPAQHRRPRSRRAGHHRRPPLRRTAATAAGSGRVSHPRSANLAGAHHPRGQRRPVGAGRGRRHRRTTRTSPSARPAPGRR